MEGWRLPTYNAYTIQLINNKNERESIRNINKSLGVLRFKGPWSEPFAVVGGRTMTLDDIEQRTIRPTFREPRIHFALVCAAIGCPPLRNEAYTGARVEAQLEDQAKVFLAQTPAKNRVDVANCTVYRSQVFSFSNYMNDFGGSEAAAGRFIARYYPPGAERTLLECGEFKVVKTEYDWSLNSQSNARRLGLVRWYGRCWNECGRCWAVAQLEELQRRQNGARPGAEERAAVCENALRAPAREKAGYAANCHWCTVASETGHR